MNVPKLRFKEFNDEYKVCKLKNVSEIYDGTHKTPNYVDYGVKFVSVENIYNLLSTTKYISEADFDKYKIKPEYNDVFMSRIGNIGTSSVYKSNAKLAFYVSLALLRTKDKDILVPDYLNQYIKSIYFQRELHNRTIHVAFPKKINTGEIGECNLNLCSKEEQLKIAYFLSLLDKKIELQTKKIEDLKLFKLSKYNSVFSKSNNIIKLSDICKIEKGKQINSDLLRAEGNYYMLNGGILPSGYLNEYNTNENTITISEGGNSCGYVNFNKTKFWCGGHCYKIISSSVNASYLYHLLKYNEKIIMDLRVGSGLPNIQRKDLEKLKLSIHKSDDQLKIGILFDTFDKKINLETNRLNKFKELKKSLMQSIFV